MADRYRCAVEKTAGELGETVGVTCCEGVDPAARPAGRPVPTGALQQVAHLERGLVRARNECDTPAHDLQDRPCEQREVGAPEHECVDAGVEHRSEPLADDVECSRGVDVACLDEFHEARACVHADGHVKAETLRCALVDAAERRQARADHHHAPGSRRGGSSTQSWSDDTDDGDR